VSLWLAGNQTSGVNPIYFLGSVSTFGNNFGTVCAASVGSAAMAVVRGTIENGSSTGTV
jgi:hypothetical protein